MAREVYSAIVSRVNDPKKLGRIRVQCQAIAAAGAELPFWIKPCFPFTSKGSGGWFALPEVGSEVEIEVNTSSPDDETHNESFISAPDVHWRAAMYSKENPLAEEFTKNYGKRRGWRSPAGHVLYFDDTEGSEEIVLQHKGGISIILDKDGKILLGGTDVTDLVAMAAKVEDELDKLRTAINGHAHSCPNTGTGTPVSVGAADSGTAGAVSAVGSQIVHLK